ncbi:MAG: SpoIIE family protein phosphatase [Archangium sp.]|nr:SpoIIE family protein phosphatase [Archangium sp.]
MSVASRLTLSTATRLRPFEGLTACGDAVVEARAQGWHLVAVIDALGHGPDAALSAHAARKAVEEAAGQPLASVFAAVHRSLDKLRGVVMSALLVEGDQASFAGVGNVEVFAPEGVSRPVTMAGTLGGGPYRFRSFALALEVGQRWALASDGIKAREGSALFQKHRQAPARELVDLLIDHAGRPHDDVAVMVIDVEAAS